MRLADEVVPRQSAFGLGGVVAHIVVGINLWNVGVRNLDANVPVILVPNLLPVVFESHQRQTLQVVSSPEKSRHVAVLRRATVLPLFVRYRISDAGEVGSGMECDGVVHGGEWPHASVSR